MALIKVADRGGREQVNKVLQKATTKKTATSVRTGSGLVGRIKEIEKRVNSDLGKYAEESLLINTEEQLHDYISKCINQHVIAIDTETTGLDPLQDDIVGFSIYTPNEKTAYIPINHISYIIQQKAQDQLSIEVCRKELQRVADAEIQVIMFNAAFDTRVIMNHIGVRLICTWDCSIGARCLNENEEKGQGGLKILHQKYVLKGVGDAFKFDDLFKGITFNLIPIKVGYLYAAHDAKITYELMKFQEPYLTYDPTVTHEARNGLNGVAWVFHNIEMPCVQAVVDMENVGVAFDFEKNAEFKVKYHALLEEKETAFHELCKPYADKIQAYINTNGVLENPINIRSTKQLPIFLYDIAKVPPVIDKKTKQPLLKTSEEILSQIDHPLCKAILEYRSFEKLVSTYIDKLPECVNPKDGRIHPKFNQYGAKCITGDSVVLTDKGYVQISNLFSSDDKEDEMISDLITIVNKDMQFEQASHRVMYHNRDTIKLVLRGGYEIEGTPNHPIVVSNISLSDIMRNKCDRQIRRLGETQHFEQLSNIKVGDTVAIPYGYNIFPTEYVKLDCNLIHTKTYNSRQCTIPEYCNEEFAELLGMYHADGTYKHQKDKFTISIHNKDKDVIERVKYLAKSLFNLDVHTWDDGKTVSTIFGSLQIQEVEKYLVKGARNKRVPDIIMQSPKSVVCAYIRGLTLDSTFDSNRQRLLMSCMNRDAFNFLQSALLNMGILTQVHNCKDVYTHDHMGNEVEPINIRRLGISGEMYGKFLSEIGFVQSSKKLYLERYKKNRYLTYNNVYYAYVKDVQYGNADVYDLHVPNTHSFIANGIINHNTGRFSSQDPNAQNIPSHNKEIRTMFKATDGYVMMSADYSQQEPRCLAALCRMQGDDQLYNTFMQGKDLYAEIASKAFNRSYEDCLEFYLDENGKKTDKTNKEGKKYRTSAKSVLLGVLYGRGTASIGEQLNCSKEKAQDIKDSVFNGFPAIKQFEDKSLKMAQELGYVTTVCGRKRRLPEMQMDEFEFHWLKGMSPDDDPLDFDGNATESEVDEDLQYKWLQKLKKCRFGEKEKIINYAKQDGIRIVDNGGKIAEATRQVVNSRIQGSSADMTKLAMIKLWKNKRLKELGFRMLIQVHDEIIAECKEENLKECSELFSKIMSEAAEDILEMSIGCDVECTRVWYGEPINGSEIKEKETNTSHGMDVEKIKEKINGTE